MVGFSTEVVSFMLKKFYVDDGLKSVEDENEALEITHDLITLHGKGGFKLNKRVSNSRTLLLSIPEKNRSKEIKDLDFEQDMLNAC